MAASPAVGIAAMAKTDPNANVQTHPQTKITLRPEQGTGHIPCPVAKIQLTRFEHRPGFFNQIVVGEIVQIVDLSGNDRPFFFSKASYSAGISMPKRWHSALTSW
jgi:hypothetical protein